MYSGISVIVICHNGASRLPVTLAHLKAQAKPAVPWEVLLIDNASTDDSAKVALSCWGEGPTALRVFRQPRFGYTKERGFVDAKYEFVAFVDEDTWLSPDWVLVTSETLLSDPSLGAVGSICEPVFEVSEPEWFREFHSIYSILTDSDLDQCESPEHLQVPGVCVRKQAWVQLQQGGFRSLLSKRVRRQPSGGSDPEMTLAIRLAGWKLRVDPRLRLQRCVSAQHLRWEHLRRLQRRCEARQALLDAYSTHNLSMRMGVKQQLGQLWWCQVGRSLLKLICRADAVFAALTSNGENRQEVIEVEKWFGRMLGMLELRGGYHWSRRHIRYAPWRLRRPEEYLRRSQEAPKC